MYGEIPSFLRTLAYFRVRHEQPFLHALAEATQTHVHVTRYKLQHCRTNTLI